jgi:hypothetical protein
MNFGLELRLASLNVEMDALVDGFDIIKKSIKMLKDEELHKFKNSIKSDNNLTEDKIIDIHMNLYNTIEVLYPKVFWGFYLISVHSFFETAAWELSEKISTTMGYDKDHSNAPNRDNGLLEFIKTYYGKKPRIIDPGCYPYWETIT